MIYLHVTLYMEGACVGERRVFHMRMYSSRDCDQRFDCSFWSLLGGCHLIRSPLFDELYFTCCNPFVLLSAWPPPDCIIVLPNRR